MGSRWVHMVRDRTSKSTALFSARTLQRVRGEDKWEEQQAWAGTEMVNRRPFRVVAAQIFTPTHVTHHHSPLPHPVLLWKQASTSTSLSGATPQCHPAPCSSPLPRIYACHPPLPRLVYSWKQATASPPFVMPPLAPAHSFTTSPLSPTQMPHLVYSWKQATKSASLSGATLCLISSKSSCLQALMLQHAPEDEDTGKQT